MSDHEKLSKELGTSQDNLAGMELTDQELDEVAGGADTTIIKTETTIISGGIGDSPSPAT